MYIFIRKQYVDREGTFTLTYSHLEDCRRRLQLRNRPGIEPGPYWPEA